MWGLDRKAASQPVEELVQECAATDAGTRSVAAADADKTRRGRVEEGKGGSFRVRARSPDTFSKTGMRSDVNAQPRQDRLHRRITCPKIIRGVTHLLVWATRFLFRVISSL